MRLKWKEEIIIVRDHLEGGPVALVEDLEEGLVLEWDLVVAEAEEVLVDLEEIHVVVLKEIIVEEDLVDLIEVDLAVIVVEETDLVVIEEDLMIDQEKCIKQFVQNVRKNVKFRSSLERVEDRYIVEIVLIKRESKKIDNSVSIEL